MAVIAGSKQSSEYTEGNGCITVVMHPFLLLIGLVADAPPSRFAGKSSVRSLSSPFDSTERQGQTMAKSKKKTSSVHQKAAVTGELIASVGVALQIPGMTTSVLLATLALAAILVAAP